MPARAADLSGFAPATAAVHKQADLAFIESNKITRDVSIDRFIKSGQPGLSEDKFNLAVSPDDIAAWDTTLGDIETYGTTISALNDDNRAKETGDNLVALGKELNGGVVGAKIKPGVATGFASLGDTLVKWKGQASARRVLAATDPSIQDILLGMAQAIGATDHEGLRGTVRAAWTASFGDVRIAYAKSIAQPDLARRRALVLEFLAAVDKRDAQLRGLSNLRASLLTLAAAHHAAAAGQDRSIGSLLKLVGERADETARLYDAVKAQSK